MPVVKRVLCLSNSRKPGGTCFAGRIIEHGRIGPWIRPVGVREGEAVSVVEQRFSDGTVPRLLDVVDVPVLTPNPHACQTENWLLDSSRRWIRVCRASRNEVLACVEDPGKLWINGHSTRNGYHDEIPLEEANHLTNSLVLVKAPKLRLRVLAPGHDFGNPERRVQGFFVHGGVKYGLRVTDSQIECEYLKREDGIYELGESLIAVSISEPFRKSNGADFRYKLIAAIIESAALEEDM